MLILSFHVIFHMTLLNQFLQIWFLLFHSRNSLKDYQIVILIFDSEFKLINSFKGQIYLDSINIFTELLEALLIILSIISLLWLFSLMCFEIHCKLDSIYFENCFSIAKLLMMIILMTLKFLVNINLLDYFSNNS
jgi:hypothetical protein